MPYKDTHMGVDTQTYTHRPSELGNMFMLGNWQESVQFGVSEYCTHMEMAKRETYS